MCEPGLGKRTLFYLAAAVLILVLGCVAVLLLLKRAEGLSKQRTFAPLGVPGQSSPVHPGR
ncbi:MAG: hypothetical protein N3I86_09205 [Verrucomicrobiae bacterium]|nr:hypothetical protein [Verrucomicrobiae bacterium]